MTDFATVPEMVAALAEGRMIILVDDEDRENEGDLVVAAERLTVEQLVQMNRLASGIITVPMPRVWLERLHIDPMVQKNAESMNTAFTVTVDARRGTTTGSSGHDRVATIRRLADPEARADDFVRPGHVNPLMVREGGVLKRPGHTEASADLMVLAGLQPVAVLCEIMDDTGAMSRLGALEELAQKLEIPLGTIADVVRYRLRNECLIGRAGAAEELSTPFGRFHVQRYESQVDAGRYTAFLHGFAPGEANAQAPTLVRVHHASLTGDLLGLLGASEGGPPSRIRRAFEQVHEAGSGVILYIESDPRAIGSMDERNYGIGAQILVDLGLRRLRLLSDTPKRRAALDGFGLEVVDHVPLGLDAKVVPMRQLSP
ncbi:MAG: 3,4-dihydroxy-2-butanone-4-phosphate synthase [Polyangiaceae bacterium]